MPQKSFEITVIKFEGTDAILKIEDTGYEFRLPIQKLPQELEEGGSLSLKILSPEDSKNEYDHIARATLEALLN